MSTLVNNSLRPITPLMQHSGCILQSTAGSFHGKCTSNLRQEVSEPPFRIDLIQKHGCSDEVYQEVDGLSLRVAARNYQSTDVHLLKLVHNLLPTRRHTAQFQPWTSPQCPYGDEAETMEHLQQNKYHSSFLCSIQRFFTSNNTRNNCKILS